MTKQYFIPLLLVCSININAIDFRIDQPVPSADMHETAATALISAIALESTDAKHFLRTDFIPLAIEQELEKYNANKTIYSKKIAAPLVGSLKFELNSTNLITALYQAWNKNEQSQQSTFKKDLAINVAMSALPTRDGKNKLLCNWPVPIYKEQVTASACKAIRNECKQLIHPTASLFSLQQRLRYAQEHRNEISLVNGAKTFSSAMASEVGYNAAIKLIHQLADKKSTAYLIPEDYQPKTVIHCLAKWVIINCGYAIITNLVH